MPYCSVSTCRNHNSKTKGTHITYHTFPRDSKLRKLWEHKCYRKDKFNVENGRICSNHFASDSYERDLKAELLGLLPKKRLKADAVPSLNIPVSYTSCNDNSGRKERVEARRTKRKLIQEINEHVSEVTQVMEHHEAK